MMGSGSRSRSASKMHSSEDEEDDAAQRMEEASWKAFVRGVELGVVWSSESSSLVEVEEPLDEVGTEEMGDS